MKFPSLSNQNEGPSMANIYIPTMWIPLAAHLRHSVCPAADP